MRIAREPNPRVRVAIEHELRRQVRASATRAGRRLESAEGANAPRTRWRLVGVVVTVLAATPIALAAILPHASQLGATPASFSQAPLSADLGTGQQAAFADSGPAGEVTAVKKAVQQAFDAQIVAAEVTNPGELRLSSKSRLKLLTAYQSAALAQKTNAAIQFAADQKPYVRSGRFMVTDWQGVAVEGEYAKAYVTGYETGNTLSGERWQTTPYQSRMLLEKSETGWKLVKVVGSSNG